MNENVEKKFDYQFTAVPTNLYLCCDNNVRSMLATLVQLSSYYADSNGWFFRTNEDLRVESQLSENLVRATLSTLYSIGVVEVKTVGKGKSKTPNQFKLNVERFKDWEKYSLEDCIKHPDLRIGTDNYKRKGWQPSYLQELEVKTDEVPILSPISLPTSSQSEDYIENIDNKENNLSEGSKQVEVKSNQFEVYKRQEDMLMDKLYNAPNWTDFKYIRGDIDKLISTAASEKVAEKTKKRYKKIEEGKIKYFKNKLSKEPYNKFYDDFYREYNCGWLGKEDAKEKQNRVQPQSSNDMEEDDKDVMRNFYARMGVEIPDEYKPKRELSNMEILGIPNPNDEDDKLPF